MFAKQLNPAMAYSNIGVETSISEASPHQLVVLLFEGARQAMLVARAGMENGDIQTRTGSSPLSSSL